MLDHGYSDLLLKGESWDGKKTGASPDQLEAGAAGTETQSSI